MNKLSVVHLAQSDSEGGANKAAYRIHQNLQSLGMRSTFHVGRKRLIDPSVIPAHLPGAGLRVSDVVAYLNARQLKAYPARSGTPFSPVGLRYGHLNKKLISQADVVCLHWIAGAFLNFDQLQAINKPIVWRLSDIWPFSGGCHYPGDCESFERECGSCPQLGSDQDSDLSRVGMDARTRAFSELNLTIAAPSKWIADLARRSSLFGARRIEHIPTGVNLDVFRPRDRTEARKRFGLPEHGKIVLFGALGATEDPRKGYPQFVRCLERLVSMSLDDITPVVFGGAEQHITSVAGLPIYHVGRIQTENDMSLIYSAADVLVAPFLEDNLPNVILEAIACGTAVAAFSAGGIRDAIENDVSGTLAPIGDDETLAHGVARLLNRSDDPIFRRSVRSFAESRFDLNQCVSRYARLFEDVASAAAA